MSPFNWLLLVSNFNYPWIRQLLDRWEQMIDTLRYYKPCLYYQKVQRKLPSPRQIACNTNGASRGNPAHSACGFILRDEAGNFIYAESQYIGITTNMEVESMAIWRTLCWCSSKDLQKIQLYTDSLAMKSTAWGVE